MDLNEKVLKSAQVLMWENWNVFWQLKQVKALFQNYMFPYQTLPIVMVGIF